MNYVPTETSVYGALTAAIQPISTVICLDPSLPYQGISYDQVRIDCEFVWLIRQIPNGCWRVVRAMRDPRNGVETVTEAHVSGSQVESRGIWKWEGGDLCRRGVESDLTQRELAYSRSVRRFILWLRSKRQVLQ